MESDATKSDSELENDEFPLEEDPDSDDPNLDIVFDDEPTENQDSHFVDENELEIIPDEEFSADTATLTDDASDEVIDLGPPSDNDDIADTLIDDSSESYSGSRNEFAAPTLC